MLALLHADLVSTVRLWVGVFAVLFVSGAVAGLPAALLDTAAHSELTAMLGLLAIASVVIALTAVSMTVVISAAIRTFVELRRRTIALWLIAGMSPGHVAAIFLGQLTVVSVTSAVMGAGAAMFAIPQMVEFLLAGSGALEAVPVSLGVGPAAAGAGATVAIAVLAAAPLARDVGRTPLLRLLRGGEHRAPRAIRRAVFATSVASVAAAMAAGLPGSLTTGASQSVLIGPLLIAVAAIVAPFFLPHVTRAWTALVPARLSASWHLARASALSAARRSSAAIVSFIVAIGVPWTFLVGQQTVATASDRATELSFRPLVLLLGAPALLAAIGAGAQLYMASDARSRDDNLLRTLGASPITRVLVMVWEPVIYVGTAALTCAALGGVVALSESLILTSVAPTAHPATAPAVLIALAGGCVVIALTATFASCLHDTSNERGNRISRAGARRSTPARTTPDSLETR